MWIEFVGSVLCSERFFFGYSCFPFSPKNNIWFDLICCDSVWFEVSSISIKPLLLNPFRLTIIITVLEHNDIIILSLLLTTHHGVHLISVDNDALSLLIYNLINLFGFVVYSTLPSMWCKFIWMQHRLCKLKRESWVWISLRSILVTAASMLSSSYVLH